MTRRTIRALFHRPARRWRGSGAALVVGTALLCVLVVAPAAWAQKSLVFIAVLNGGQEVPPVDSNAFGVAYLTLGGNMLCHSISYDGLSSGETVAHIHGPARSGNNAGVVFDLVAGAPKNDCVGPLSNKQRNELKKGMYYINIHTANNGGGEIRGQILQMKTAK